MVGGCPGEVRLECARRQSGVGHGLTLVGIRDRHAPIARRQRTRSTPCLREAWLAFRPAAWEPHDPRLARCAAKPIRSGPPRTRSRFVARLDQRCGADGRGVHRGARLMSTRLGSLLHRGLLIDARYLLPLRHTVPNLVVAFSQRGCLRGRRGDAAVSLQFVGSAGTDVSAAPARRAREDLGRPVLAFWAGSGLLHVPERPLQSIRLPPGAAFAVLPICRRPAGHISRREWRSDARVRTDRVERPGRR